METVFGVEHNVSLAQECARAVLIFFYGLALLRLTGRRTFAHWSALDVLLSIIIGSNLSRALTGSVPLAGTLLASALLVGLHVTVRARRRTIQTSFCHHRGQARRSRQERLGGPSNAPAAHGLRVRSDGGATQEGHRGRAWDQTHRPRSQRRDHRHQSWCVIAAFFRRGQRAGFSRRTPLNLPVVFCATNSPVVLSRLV